MNSWTSRDLPTCRRPRIVTATPRPSRTTRSRRLVRTASSWVRPTNDATTTASQIVGQVYVDSPYPTSRAQVSGTRSGMVVRPVVACGFVRCPRDRIMTRTRSQASWTQSGCVGSTGRWSPARAAASRARGGRTARRRPWGDRSPVAAHQGQQLPQQTRPAGCPAPRRCRWTGAGTAWPRRWPRPRRTRHTAVCSRTRSCWGAIPWIRAIAGLDWPASIRAWI